MNEILTIKNVHGFMEKNGMVYLNARDVAIGLGFTQEKHGVEYVRWETVNGYLREFGFSQHVGKDDFIPENIVYRLGFKASNETALGFQAFLADEVLPTIRKHGAYMTPAVVERCMKDPGFMIQLLQNVQKLNERNQALEADNCRMKPKEIFADAVSSSHTSILVGELAKILKGNGIEIGQKRLFNWLRDHGYLIKRRGSDCNMPTQRAMEMGLFEIKEGSYINSSGASVITKTPKVTGKGQIYFVNKFLADKSPGR